MDPNRTVIVARNGQYPDPEKGYEEFKEVNQIYPATTTTTSRVLQICHQCKSGNGGTQGQLLPCYCRFLANADPTFCPNPPALKRHLE